MRSSEDSDPEELRRARQRWILAGLALVILGSLAIRAASSGS